jgi:hypothetical protein
MKDRLPTGPILTMDLASTAALIRVFAARVEP